MLIKNVKEISKKHAEKKLLELKSMSLADLIDIGAKPADVERIIANSRVQIGR